MYPLMVAPVSQKGISFAGKTDSGIIEEVLKANELYNDNFASWKRELFKQLPGLMMEGGRDGKYRYQQLKGGLELVQRLSVDDRFHVGLLTGNIVGAAHAKLTLAGYPVELFKGGAFGCDHPNRNELVPIAKVRCVEMAGATDFVSTIVIGDTPRDIFCARAGHAKVIAVETGGHTREELLKHDPDAVFADLSETDSIIEHLLHL